MEKPETYQVIPQILEKEEIGDTLREMDATITKQANRIGQALLTVDAVERYISALEIITETAFIHSFGDPHAEGVFKLCMMISDTSSGIIDHLRDELKGESASPNDPF